MKRLIPVLVMILVCGCESMDRNAQLRKERNDLQTEISSYGRTITRMKDEVADLRDEISGLRDEKKMASSGKRPVYMVVVKIHQGTFTLDPFEHIKNSMNDITLWIETSESYYRSVKKGDELSGKMKSGSFWIDGDISHLHITIEDKKIK